MPLIKGILALIIGGFCLMYGGILGFVLFIICVFLLLVWGDEWFA